MNATTMPRAPKTKGLIRSQNRAATTTGKRRPAEGPVRRAAEPTACESCGAIFFRRVWRRGRKVSQALLDRVRWRRCPSCRQSSLATGLGRILIRGPYAETHDTLVRQRIANVAERAAYTQPQRRLVSVERRADVLEVLTTSQKLAHRIVRELKKAFSGRVSYAWSDDGTLFATWQR